MQGIVVELKRQGVIAKLDGTPDIGDLFEVYRVQDGVEVILAKGYMRKSKGENFKINPIDLEDGSRGLSFDGVLEGDLVRSVAS